MKKLAVVLALSLVACGIDKGDKSGDETPQPEEQTLTGVAATGAPISGVTLTFKDAHGVTATVVTGADGSYTLKTTTLSFPVLLRIESSQGALFSSAFAAGVANVHPFTNLVVRNWFKVQGIDVEGAFANAQPIQLPTVTEIETIKAVVRELVATRLAEVGLDAPSFDFFTTPFQADGAGFDRVLDQTTVSIDPVTSTVTLSSSDPATGLETTSRIDLSQDLGRADTTAPSAPSGLTAAVAGTSTVVLAWTSSTDDVAVAGYNVYRGGDKIASSAYPVFKNTGLQANTQYCYAVEAFDAKGNLSSRSAEVCATTLNAADTSAPSTPAGLEARAVSSRSIALSWSASTDANGVLGYRIRRGGVDVTAVPGTSFADLGLSANTRYCYTVAAFDAAGNVSSASTEACATTPATDPALATARGTYTYVGGTLTIHPTESTGCDGPKAGQAESWAVSNLTSTSMTWTRAGNDPPVVWTRASGTSGDPTGTWLMSEQSGRSYKFTVDADGTWALIWNPGQCQPDGGATAHGTYSVNAGTLVIQTAESSGCNGPQAGQPETFALSAVSATSMTWTKSGQNQPMVWTRVSGTSADLTGTWQMTQEGRGYTLTLEAGGTWSMVWDPGECQSPVDDSAQGTYTFVAGALTVNFTQSTGGCNGPSVGTEIWAVSSLTATSMTWTKSTGGNEMTWTRASGTAGEIAGSWAMSSNGGSYALTMRSDGTFQLTWTSTGCSQGSLPLSAEFDLGSVAAGEGLRSLASDGTSVYLYKHDSPGAPSAKIWKIDPTTGNVLATYPLSLSYGVDGGISWIDDLAWHQNALWAVGGFAPTAGNLQRGIFRVNLGSSLAEAGIVAGAGIDLGGQGLGGLASDGAALYVAVDLTEATNDIGIVRFDPTGVSTIPVAPFTATPQHYSQLDYSGGLLWGGPGWIQKIDPSTGQTTGAYSSMGPEGTLVLNGKLWTVDGQWLRAYQLPQ